jgi:hypothetical protein
MHVGIVVKTDMASESVLSLKTRLGLLRIKRLSRRAKAVLTLVGSRPLRKEKVTRKRIWIIRGKCGLTVGFIW